MSIVDVKLKKLVDNVEIPFYASEGAACADVIAVSERFDKDGFVEYGLGFSLEIPTGYKVDIRPRSSISSKTDLVLINSPGTIDSDYRGEIKVRFKPVKPVGAKRYKVGDKIAQIMISPVLQMKFEEVNELSDTDRGEGGFGSTGS